jgi:hypothetical protein
MSYLKSFTHKQQIFGTSSSTSPSKKRLTLTSGSSNNPKDLKQAREDADEDYIEVNNSFSFFFEFLCFFSCYRQHLKD